MKQRIPLTSILLAAVAAVAFAAAFFALVAPPVAEAQSPGINFKKAAPWLTNDIPVPWSTVTAGANSNVTGYGNAGGYAASGAVRLPYQQPIGLIASFSCPTVTLANVAVVLQLGTDSNLWHTLPPNCPTLNSGASASSANPTNVAMATNLTAAQLAGYNWIRAVSTTNGNAANLTSLRLQMTSP